jgi:signal transduction histidine kinase
MTQRATEIIRHISEHVRGAEPQRLPIAVNDIVRSVAPLIEADAHEHRVRLSFDLERGMPPVRADRIEIENVILNLVRNGIDAMERTEQGRRELRIQTALLDDGQVEVAVRDAGGGMAPEVRDRLFEPFFTTKSGGMGMGLAICRTTIEAHGGRMWVTSEAGGGSIARFVLPIAERDSDEF